MTSDDRNHRSHLPMPNTARRGLITYDAKDPDTKFPPIEQLRPPKGAPNVLLILIDDAGFGSASAFGGPCQTPNAEKLAANGLKYNRFHTTALCSPTRQATADRAQPPHRRHGRHHRDRQRLAGLQFGAPEHHFAAGTDAEAQRLLHRAVRQVPRSAGVGNKPGRAVRCLADGRRRLRVFLWLPRWRGKPVVPDDLRRHHAGRSKEDARRGLPLHGGHDRQGHGVDLAAEGAGCRQAFLRLLRTRRHSRPAPRAEGMGRQVQGQVRPGLGQAPRGDLRAAKGSGRHSAGMPTHRAPQGNPGVGRHAGGVETGIAPANGSLRRLHGIHRSPCRPPARWPAAS